jgi:hypothetical protein
MYPFFHYPDGGECGSFEWGSLPLGLVSLGQWSCFWTLCAALVAVVTVACCHGQLFWVWDVLYVARFLPQPALNWEPPSCLPLGSWECRTETLEWTSWFLEGGLCPVAQADLEARILLPQSPKCRDVNCAPSVLSYRSAFCFSLIYNVVFGFIIQIDSVWRADDACDNSKSAAWKVHY